MGGRRIRQRTQGVPERNRGPLRDLTFWELALPWVNFIMIDDLLQGKVPAGHRGGAAVLLKGCERLFQPEHSQSRYCSPACRAAAERWRHWRASQTWRKTESGRACRRQQSCRYRQRVRQRREAEQAVTEEGSEGECEGQRPADSSGKIPCARPGCYEQFVPSQRCPSSEVLFVLVPSGFAASSPA